MVGFVSSTRVLRRVGPISTTFACFRAGSCSFTQSTVSGACDTGNTCVAGATNHPATGVKGRLSTGDSICDHGCKESFHGDAFTQICGSSDSGATCSVSSNWTSFGTGTATGGYCDNPNSGEPAGDGTVGPAGVGGPCVGNQCYKAPAQICDGPACASAGSTSSVLVLRRWQIRTIAAMPSWHRVVWMRST